MTKMLYIKNSTAQKAIKQNKDYHNFIAGIYKYTQQTNKNVKEILDLLLVLVGTYNDTTKVE